MNIWQKLCVAVGAIAIAVVLLAYPVKHPFSLSSAIWLPGQTATAPQVSGIDYKATALRVSGIVASTAAITVLLGFINRPK